MVIKGEQDWPEFQHTTNVLYKESTKDKHEIKDKNYLTEWPKFQHNAIKENDFICVLCKLPTNANELPIDIFTPI